MLKTTDNLTSYSLAAGEPFLLSVQVRDNASNAIIDMSQRPLVLSFYEASTRTVAAQIDGVITTDASGAFFRFARDGAFSDNLFGKSLSVELAERLKGGRNTLAVGRMEINTSALTVATYGSIVGRTETRISVYLDAAGIPRVWEQALLPFSASVVSAPVFTTPASIASDGTPQVGEQLTGVDGVATDTVSYTRRWLFGGDQVATTKPYTPQTPGAYTYEVTAVGAGGSAVSSSSTNVTAATIPAPAFTKAPAISPTSGLVGATFTATDGTVSNGSVASRRWLLSGTSIGTGTTVVPLTAGSLVLENTATGTDGSTITSTSSSVTVSAQTVTPTLTLTGPLGFTAGSAAGTLVANIGNVPSGQTPVLVAPTDGTLAIAGGSGSGWKIVVGLNAAIAGSIQATVSATGANNGSATIAVGTQPTIGISGTPSLAEGSGGSTSFLYTIARSNTDGALTLHWSFSAGTTSPNDFSGGAYPAGADVTIPDGQKTVSFTVAVNGDQDQEDNETFTVAFAPPSGYQAGTTSVTSTITNDDTGADNGTTVSYATNNIASAATYGGTKLTASLPNNKIAIATQGYSGTLQKRVEQVQIFDRTAKTISAPYTVFPDLLRLDDHGVPYIAYWAAGNRLYVFGGGHSNPLQVGVSGQGDFTTYTPLSQIIPSQSGQNGLCYASPVIVGNTLHLYARLELSTMMPYWYGRFSLNADGTMTKVDERVLFDLGNVPQTGSSGGQVGTRVYGGAELISSNGDEAIIELSCTQANYADNWRRNGYIMLHDTAAGTLSSAFGAAYSRSTATQCPGATVEANFKVIDQSSQNLFGGGNRGVLDSAGRRHFIYTNDVDASSLNDPSGTNPLDVYHMIYQNGTFSTPVVVPQLQRKNRYDNSSTVADGTGLICYKVGRSASYSYQRGGDINSCRWDPVNGWGADTLIDSANSYCALDRVQAFSQYGDDLNLFYAEGVVPPSQGATGGANNFTMGNTRTFLRNKAGLIKFPWTPHPTSQAFAARLSVAPTVSQMRSLDALVVGWANSAHLAEMDAAWMLAAWSEEAALKNLIQDRFNLQKVNAVARRQVANQTGSALVGAGGYLVAPDFVPSTATSLKMGLSSVGVSAWGLEDVSQAPNDIYTLNGANSSIVMNLKNASGNFSGQPNGAFANAITISNPSGIGFFAMRRTSTTSGAGYRNYEADQFAATNGGTVSNLPNKAIALFGNDTSTTNSTRALGIVTMGSLFNSNGGEGPQTLAAPGQRFLVEMGVLSA